MAKANRGPHMTLKSDDFEMEDGEETIYPHKGESVTFKRRISPSDLMLVAKSTSLEENLELARFMHDEICPALARAIISWTWTDIYGEETYPEKPTVETLRGLDSMTELQYLLQSWLEAAGAAATEEKNPQQPSSET
ncbi:MAG: hypothetical protein ACXAB4_03730 [Candidatus Hodarchaeales archaeon]|jgi:hypothetical protein